MDENELKSLQIYNERFDEDPTTFNEFQANDYIKLLKKNNENDQAIEVGKTFIDLCPNLIGYKNQYGYALYNKYINISDQQIAANPSLFDSMLDEIISFCRQERYSPVEPALNRAIRYVLDHDPIDYEKLITLLHKFDPASLSKEPFINKEGKEFESKIERYYRLLVRALFETKQYRSCIEQANIALTLDLKWHFNTLQWIKYYRGCALVETQQYEEAERVFLSLQNRIRGINFYEVLYRTYETLNQDKKANTYLLYEFFEKGYKVELLPLYKRLLHAVTKANFTEGIKIVTSFISILSKENNIDYNGTIDEAYQNFNSSDLYDRMYDLIMSHLSLLVERKEGTVVHFNHDRNLGSISVYDDEPIFFRQEDYVYDEEVQRRDKVEYTILPSYDTKKDRMTNRAILIITTEEYINFDY